MQAGKQSMQKKFQKESLLMFKIWLDILLWILPGLLTLYLSQFMGQSCNDCSLFKASQWFGSSQSGPISHVSSHWLAGWPQQPMTEWVVFSSGVIPHDWVPMCKRQRLFARAAIFAFLLVAISRTTFYLLITPVIATLASQQCFLPEISLLTPPLFYYLSS